MKYVNYLDVDAKYEDGYVGVYGNGEDGAISISVREKMAKGSNHAAVFLDVSEAVKLIDRLSKAVAVAQGIGSVAA